MAKMKHLSFLPGFARQAARQTRQKGKVFHFGHPTQGGARSSLALGYFLIVPLGLQFGSLRSHKRCSISTECLRKSY
jgi:hypothetical protein